MAVYKLGSVGSEVSQIQGKLAELGLYTGKVDGIFGGGTEAAVAAFQKGSALAPDGAVGPATWAKLFGGAIPEPSLAAAPVAERALALSGSFETGGSGPECFSALAGDFDGQGLSFGALQFNLGQGTLQPILSGLLADHRDVMETAFDARLPELEAALGGGVGPALAFARSIQDPVRHAVEEPWRGMFRALGRTPECQAAQTAAAGRYESRGRSLAATYGLWSERGYALMFDIAVQNGDIGSATKARILDDVAALPAGLPEEEREVEKMRIVANRRAEAASAKFVEDVRRRKLCIANGAGTVHGIAYDLAAQFGIRLAPLA